MQRQDAAPGRRDIALPGQHGGLIPPISPKTPNGVPPEVHHSTVKKLRSLLLEKEILTVYRVNCEKVATNG